MVQPPPLPAAIPPRRRSVPTTTLLAAVLGGFLWGLAMFVVGRLGPGTPAADASAATAIGQLNRLDQVIARADVAAARAQLAALALPDGTLWANAVGLRRAALETLERDQRERAAAAALLQRIGERLHPVGEPGLGLVTLAARPGQSDELLAVSAPARPPGAGSSLLRSRDGGRSWAPDARLARDGQRLPAPVALATVASSPQLLFIADGAKDRRLGWISRDGGATLGEVPRPAPAGEPDAADRTIVGGDGALVAVLPEHAGGGGAAVCYSSRDGGQHWQTGIRIAELALLAPTTGGALILARADGQRLQASVDGGQTFAAAAGLAEWSGPGPGEATCIALGELLCVRGADHRWALLTADARLAAMLPALPDDDQPVAMIIHPGVVTRWYLLTGGTGLLRSDDGGRSWRRGRGRLGTLTGTCLAFAGAGDRPALLIGGDRLWSFADEEDAALFAAPAP